MGSSYRKQMINQARANLDEAFRLLAAAEAATGSDLGEQSPAQWAYAARRSECPKIATALNAAAMAVHDLPRTVGAPLAVMNVKRVLDKPFSEYTLAEWALQAQLLSK